MLLSKKPVTLAVSLALSAIWNNAVAQSAATTASSEPLMTVVVVGSEPTDVDLNSVTLDAATLLPMRAATSDTATLLRDVPGVSFYGAGGVSSLPVIHGLADDRLRTKVDGMDLIASCPNHMNSAAFLHRPDRRVEQHHGLCRHHARSASAATASAAPSSWNRPRRNSPATGPRHPAHGRGRHLLSQQRQCGGRQSVRNRWPAKN